jgi:hypothetical protein
MAVGVPVDLAEKEVEDGFGVFANAHLSGLQEEPTSTIDITPEVELSIRGVYTLQRTEGYALGTTVLFNI